MSLATFSSMAVQRMCDPMLPELSREFDAPISEVAQVISVFAIVYGLMQLFYGPVGDRLGKIKFGLDSAPPGALPRTSAPPEYGGGTGVEMGPTGMLESGAAGAGDMGKSCA